jgi:hypothetical protein
MNEIENLFLRNLNPNKDGIIDYYKFTMLMCEQAPTTVHQVGAKSFSK